ncbi:hypothetical protein QUF70_00305, partial [Desulfobacterales bacterium HSG17]|nr:hypothetical protein [Desulfobacterales bacterium HSG17]
NSTLYWKNIKNKEYRKILEKRNEHAFYIEAWDLNTDKLLWELEIYRIEPDKSVEPDIQDVFITNMKIESNILIIKNEENDIFKVDLETKEIQPNNKIYKTNINF